MEESTLTAVYYVLYGIAFGTSMLAFLMTSMQKLRLLIALSSTSYALYYYFFPAEPLWLDVGSEVALVVINVYVLLYLAWSNSRPNLISVNSFYTTQRFQISPGLSLAVF